MKWLLLSSVVLWVGCANGRTPLEKATTLAKEAKQMALRGETTEAIDSFREAVELVPEWTLVRFDLSRLTFLKGIEHFFNHLEYNRLADEARGAGDKEMSEQNASDAKEELEIASPMLDEATRNLSIVIASRNALRTNVLNAHVWLGQINAARKNWIRAKTHFEEARDMNPSPEHMRKVLKALKVVDEAIDKEAREKVGESPL
ncbi:MAG: hypothetical protein O6952_10320 [Planctomycetota bacterium]|nr:hypothetical protein [Planctomycetota bacterium]